MVSLLPNNSAFCYNIYTDPSSPPKNISLSRIQNGEVQFTWDPVASSCPSVHYLINASDCGECPLYTDSANLTCYVELGILRTDQVCTLSIQTILCGGNTTNHHNSEATQFILRGKTAESIGRVLMTFFHLLEQSFHRYTMHGFLCSRLFYRHSYGYSACTSILQQHHLA